MATRKIYKKRTPVVEPAMEAPKVSTLDSMAAGPPAPTPTRELGNAPDKPTIGRPLPDGFSNPECGVPGHFCVDIDGNYNPTWVALMVNPGRTTESRLPFLIPEDGSIRKLNLKTGVWADVHPMILNVLADLNYNEITMDYDSKGPITDQGGQVVKAKVPAFHFSYRPSA